MYLVWCVSLLGIIFFGIVSVYMYNVHNNVYVYT